MPCEDEDRQIASRVQPKERAATFGVISAAGDPRVVQLAAKFLF